MSLLFNLFFPIVLVGFGYLFLNLASRKKEKLPPSAYIVCSIVIGSFFIAVPPIILWMTLGSTMRQYFQIFTILATFLIFCYILRSLFSASKRRRLTPNLMSKIKSEVSENRLLLLVVGISLVKFAYISLVRPIFGSDEQGTWLPAAQGFFVQNAPNPINMLNFKPITTPAWPLLVSWTYSVSDSFGTEYFRLLPVLFYLGLLSLFYLMAKENYGKKTAHVAVYLFTLLPLFDLIFYKYGFYTDQVQVFLEVATIYFFWKTIKSKSNLWPILTGMSASLAMLTYYPSWAFISFVLFILLLKIPHKKVRYCSTFLFLFVWLINWGQTLTERDLIGATVFMFFFLSTANFLFIKREKVGMNAKQILLLLLPLLPTLAWFSLQSVWSVGLSFLVNPTFTQTTQSMWAQSVHSVLPQTWSVSTPTLAALIIFLLVPFFLPTLSTGMLYAKVKGLIPSLKRKNEFFSLMVVYLLYSIYILILPFHDLFNERSIIHSVTPLILISAPAVSSGKLKDKVVILIIAVCNIFQSPLLQAYLKYSDYHFWDTTIRRFQATGWYDFLNNEYFLPTMYLGLSLASVLFAFDILSKLSLTKKRCKIVLKKRYRIVLQIGHLKRNATRIFSIILSTLLVTVTAIDFGFFISYTFILGNGNLCNYAQIEYYRQVKDNPFIALIQTCENVTGEGNFEQAIVSIRGNLIPYNLHFRGYDLLSPHALERMYDVFHTDNMSRILEFLSDNSVKYISVPKSESVFYDKLPPLKKETELFDILGNKMYFRYEGSNQLWEVYSLKDNTSKDYLGFTTFKICGEEKLNLFTQGEINCSESGQRLREKTERGTLLLTPLPEKSFYLASAFDVSGAKPVGSTVYFFSYNLNVRTTRVGNGTRLSYDRPWQVINLGLGSVTLDYSDYKSEDASLKIEGTTGNSSGYLWSSYRPSEPIDLSNYSFLTLWVKIDEAQNPDAFSIMIYDSNNSRSSWRLEHKYPEWNSSEWCKVILPLDIPDYSVSHTNLSDIIRIDACLRADLSSSATYHLDDISASKSTIDEIDLNLTQGPYMDDFSTLTEINLEPQKICDELSVQQGEIYNLQINIEEITGWAVFSDHSKKPKLLHTTLKPKEPICITFSILENRILIDGKSIEVAEFHLNELNESDSRIAEEMGYFLENGSYGFPKILGLSAGKYHFDESENVTLSAEIYGNYMFNLTSVWPVRVDLYEGGERLVAASVDDVQLHKDQEVNLTMNLGNLKQGSYVARFDVIDPNNNMIICSKRVEFMVSEWSERNTMRMVISFILKVSMGLMAVSVLYFHLDFDELKTLLFKISRALAGRKKT